MWVFNGWRLIMPLQPIGIRVQPRFPSIPARVLLLLSPVKRVGEPGGLDIESQELDTELVSPGGKVVGGPDRGLGVVSQWTKRIGKILPLPLSTYAVLGRV